MKNNQLSNFQTYAQAFFWDYKRCDNTEYNFNILQKQISFISDQDKLLIKPSLITISSIIECALYDFLCRIKQHTIETIPNFDKHHAKQKIKEIENLPDMLNNLNDIFRKHHLLGKNASIYQNINQIRELRNRAHIQNTKYSKPLREDNDKLWTIDNLKLCYDAMKQVYSYLAKNHPRGVNDISEPFPELLIHFT